MDLLMDLYNVYASLAERLYCDFFFWVLNTSISASFLVAAIILIRMVLKKAPKAMIVALWGLVAIRLICPFSLESAFSLIPSDETIPTEQFQYQETMHEDYELQIVSNPIYPEKIEYKMPGDVENNSIDSMVFYVIWISGIGIMLVYSVVSYILIKRKVRVSAPYKENIFLCDGIKSPFILGLFKPKIYLPSDVPDEEKEYVIAHENAHLKRRDHWWKPLGFVLLTVHWFNPFMWVAYILLCRDIEFACDEKVIKSLGVDAKKPYSEALLKCSVPRKMITACPVAFGETSVKERIKSVLNYKKPAFWVIILAVVASVIVVVCFMTNPISEKEKEYSELGYRLKITVETYEGTTQFPDDTQEYWFTVEQNKKEKLDNGVKFEIEQTNLQTGELTLELSGTSLFDTKSFPSVEMKNITVSELTDGITLSTKDYNQFVIFEFIKIQDIDEAISLAVSNKYRSIHPRQMGTYSCEVHETLSTERVESENYAYDETVKAYIFASYGEYVMLNKSIFCLYGNTSPAILTFEFNDGNYKLVEYKEALYYDDEIKELLSGTDGLQDINRKLYNLKTKKINTHFSANSLAYTATTNSKVVFNVTDMKLDGDKPFIEIELYNGSNESVVADFVCDLYFAKNTSDSVIWVEYDLFDNSEMWNYKRPVVRPYESEKFKYDLSNCVFTSDGGYRIFTQYYNRNNEYSGQAIIDFVLGDVYNEQNSIEHQIIAEESDTTESKRTTIFLTQNNTLLTSQNHSTLINDYSSMLSWANYVPDGENIIMNNAEKAFYSPYSSDSYRSVAMFETKEGFNRFYNETSNSFSYNHSWDEIPSFENTSKQYDDDFFKKYNLLLVYVIDSTSSSRYKTEKIWSDNGILHIDLSRNCPPVYDTMMGGWFVTIAVPKDAIGKGNVVANIVSDVTETSSSPYSE